LVEEIHDDRHRQSDEREDPPGNHLGTGRKAKFQLDGVSQVQTNSTTKGNSDVRSHVDAAQQKGCKPGKRVQPPLLP
jgi:hypothetical protein